MAIQIPFVKTAWVDGTPNQGSAANFNHLEEGVLDVSQAPAVRVTHNTTQSLTSGVLTALAFNTERFDQAAGAPSTQHDTVTNNSRLTAVYAGVYQISGAVEFAANSTGDRALQIRLNGATVVAYHRMTVAGSGNGQMTISTLYSLAVNDYVELLALQASGGALNVNSTGNYSPEFAMVRVA